MVHGKGYTIDIGTQCMCSASHLASDLEDVGVPAAYSAQISAQSQLLTQNNVYIISTVEQPDADLKIHAIAVLVNTPLCGGLNMTSMPVCTTVFFNHHEAEVETEYMTDGTTASIALKTIHLRNLGEEVSMDWAYEALDHLLGHGVQVIPLPSQIPAMMSPILWWTTADLMAIDPAVVETGLETTYSMLFRYRCGRDRSPSHSLSLSLSHTHTHTHLSCLSDSAGVQRSYSSHGAKCRLEQVDPAHTIVTIAPYGYQAAVAALSIQVYVWTDHALLIVYSWLSLVLLYWPSYHGCCRIFLLVQPFVP